jgi:hypothetical protein
MHKKLISAAVMLLIAGAPAFAATEYYVVQKAGATTCSVSSIKPDGTTAMMVGTTAFKTKAAASAAMKAAAECKKK